MCATIKGDIINFNKAPRKTNTLTERAHLGDSTTSCLMEPIKNNMKESDTQSALYLLSYTRSAAGRGAKELVAKLLLVLVSGGGMK